MHKYILKTHLISANKRLYQNRSLNVNYRAAMSGIILELQSQMNGNGYKKLTGKYLILEVEIYRPKIFSYDLDNNLKILADCLTKAGVIKDDRYIVEINISKIESESEYALVKVCNGAIITK